jgi:hypothetical protein
MDYINYISSFIWKENNKYEEHDNIIKKIEKHKIKYRFYDGIIMYSFDNYNDEITSIKENHEAFNNFTDYYKKNINNNNLLTKIINEYDIKSNINIQFCMYSLKNMDCKKFRDFVEGNLAKTIDIYNTENINNKIRLIKKYDTFDKEKIFSDKQLELSNIFIKKKHDSDILTYEECCLENHVKILKSDIYKSYKMRDFFENKDDHYWKNKNFEKYEIRQIVEDHISYSLEDDGFVKDKYRTDSLTDYKTCDLLKDYVECYNDINKDNNKVKYIEKYDIIRKPYLMLGTNKICTILIDNDE